MLAKAETKERRQKKLEQVLFLHSQLEFRFLPRFLRYQRTTSCFVNYASSLFLFQQFFREAYALTFGLRPGERRRRSEDSDSGEVVTVMRTSLSKSEFASALGMRADAVFVKKMFNIVDKDRDGRISFQVKDDEFEFLGNLNSTFCIFHLKCYFLMMNFKFQCKNNGTTPVE